ncbi:Hypothetical predicted protein [Mytilus galloprovincialis]|uniref:Uncharacterized protein n=1 Tax=Mytilus galloprovincialis TaxID=29158 RepID=A0A8B6F7L4_MYTGA|nr:Hypothetical predicted protein [Mytilus galloprovincialis]
MAKVRRGRFTLSVNIIMTASLITRTLAFGYIMMSIYIKVGDDILDEDVIKVVDMEDVAGMPLGTTMQSIVWSLIGVFVLELLTGIFGIWGAIGRKEGMLAIIVTIVATEYTYRKFEFKEKKPRISDNKYYLLLTLQHGIFRRFVIFVKDNWKR